MTQQSHETGRQASLRPTRLALAVALALTAAAPGAVLAQSTDQGTRLLEEVTVTAQRREQSLMDVPVAVTAFTGDDLDRMGALDIIQLSQVTPNTTLEVSRGTNTTLTAFIRGVGQQDPVAGFESGVGIYLDDVYMNRPQAAVLDIYDVERIEVLRGPQGTLYGRNTIGGAIKYVTRRLSDTPEFKLRGRAGNYNMLDFTATGSVPLSDTFRIGGSFASFNRDGFGDNLNLPGLENYNKDSWGARISAEWEPADDLFFRLSADWVQDDSDPRQGHRLTVGQLSGAPILDDVFDTRAGLNNPEQDVEASGISLLAEWQATEKVQLRAILAHREDTSWTPIDFDSLPTEDLDVPALYENEQDSIELQAVFTGERWNGVAGLYYLDANAFTGFDVILATTGDLLGLPGLNAFTSGDVDTETWSAFADFTYDISDQWSVSVGGRYTDDKRSSRVLRQTMIGGTSELFGGTAIPIAVTSDFNGSKSFDKFTPRFSVQWRPNEDHSLYLSWSEGFKGGSFDPRGQTTATPDFNGDGVVSDDEVFQFMAFEPEEVESIEFGIKSTLFGGRMFSNLAVFFGSYKDVQIPGSIGQDTDGDGVSDSFIGITTNAADADINGVEWEGQAILAQDLGRAGADLSLGWAIGYIDAEYNEYIDVNGEDVADQRVFQNTPEWTVAGILTYSTPVNWFGLGGTFDVVTSASYRDDHSQFEIPNPFLDQDSYTLWDVSLVWSDDSGHWQVGLHGKNLTDEEYKVAGYYYPFPTLGLEGTVTAFYGNPRQYWLDVQYRWF
ncbi:TonB-dependent receptor [Elongatibacter sediminis]|uniref:TonB-dependent receptor n=1 Tax=Elongatibacter sediminis TaxID=3119006 RepID=A0AAW9REV8_9GAMM